MISLQVHTEQRFDEQAIHPAGRTGVPSPAAPAGVGRDGVDIRRDHIRLHLVGGDLLLSSAVMDGIEQREQFPCPIVFPHEGEGHGGPDGAVGVLTAILADARNVAFDVTGVER